MSRSRLLNHVSVAIVAVACVGIGSSIAWSTLAGSAGGPANATKANLAGAVGAPAYVGRVDFDRAFSDAAAGRGEFKPSTGTGVATARPNPAWPAGAPAYVTKADFDQAFADAAAGHREFKASVREKLRDAGWKSIKAMEGVSGAFGSGGASINRQRKSDRLPGTDGAGSATPADLSPSASKSASSTVGQSKVTIEVSRLPPELPVDCEPVAAPYVDAVLGQITGRCVT
jgi:hypothetical protein